MSLRRIRVLIVDDSAVVRKAVTDTLARDPRIEVVGTAIDPIIARDKIAKLNPDVLTLDIEMPRMDGLTFLRQLMRERPMPVIVMSSVSQSGSQNAMEALSLGAVDVLAKPGSAFTIGELSEILAERVHSAAHARLRVPSSAAPAATFAPRSSAAVLQAAAALGGASLRPHPAPTAAAPQPVSTGTPLPALAASPAGYAARQVILLGASTGGTEALRSVLTALPAGLPGIAIVQHIPAYFSKAFADRLNTLCRFAVREATDGERLTPGLALVAPGGWHMLLRWIGDHYAVQLKQGPPVWHQRPAVDILFNTAAECAGASAVAGLLTGMGRDGAEGLLRLRQRGARTLAQDEATSVVYGMPRVAAEIGAAEQVVALPDIPRALLQALEHGRRAPAS